MSENTPINPLIINGKSIWSLSPNDLSYLFESLNNYAKAERYNLRIFVDQALIWRNTGVMERAALRKIVLGMFAAHREAINALKVNSSSSNLEG